MLYVGFRSILKDMLKILNILCKNLNKGVGVSIKHISKQLNLCDCNYEYLLNLVTILEEDGYINCYELNDEIICRITLDGVEKAEEYNIKNGGI